MLKKSKALISAAAGAVVLLTSGATFALWQAEASTTAAAVRTGNISLTVESIAWQDVSPIIQDRQNPGRLIANPGGDIPWETTDLLSPGDVIRGTVTVDADLEGTNLVAELRWNTETLTTTVPDITITPGIATNAASNEITFEVAFADTATGSKGAPVSLAGATILLQQVRELPNG